jgi:hypothetical protein
MSAIVTRSSHTWAASHRLLLAVLAFAIALAATVVIVLMTSSSPPSSSVQAPGQGQTHTDQVPTGAQNQGQPDTPHRCLQYMGVRPC